MWSWQDRAACTGMDRRLFFGPDDEPRPDREIREAKAKAVCKRCPVPGACAVPRLRAPALDQARDLRRAQRRGTGA